MDTPQGTQLDFPMISIPLRELRVSAVENGFIISPTDRYGRGEDVTRGCFVFSTVEQLAAWMLKQEWKFGEADRG
jgi:hypothetical protein